MKIQTKTVGDGYKVLHQYHYHSNRYKRDIIIPKGFYSDGATDAIDINSDAWIVHDYICRYGIWYGGEKICNFQASMIVYDILKEEGHDIRKYAWFLATFLFGGGQARRNGMFSCKKI